MSEEIRMEVTKYKSLNGQIYDDKKTAEWWDKLWREENEFTDKMYEAYKSKGRRHFATMEIRMRGDQERGIIIWSNRYGAEYFVFQGIEGAAAAMEALLLTWEAQEYLRNKADIEFLQRITQEEDAENRKFAIIGFVHDKSQEAMSVMVEYVKVFYT